MVHHSPAITEIIKKLFSFSNNLIANHMMILLGAETYDPPADLDRGKEALVSFLREKIGINHFELEEAQPEPDGLTIWLGPFCPAAGSRRRQQKEEARWVGGGENGNGTRRYHNTFQGLIVS